MPVGRATPPNSSDLLVRGARIALDVGVGTGIASEQLLGRGVNVLAVEPDPRMAAVARGKGSPIEIGTFESWDPVEGRFDATPRRHRWRALVPPVSQ